jgi:hypothetical protein
MPEKIKRRLAGSPTEHSKKEADATCVGSLAWRVMVDMGEAPGTFRNEV